jgi:1-acyl-sn-glycerol-3-phosphate acyltransferase
MNADFYAWVLISLVVFTLLTWLFWCVLRAPYPLLHWVFYQLAMLIARVQWRCTVIRPVQLLADQGAVIVTNHRTSVDPFFIQVAIGARRVHWMVAKEYVLHPAFRWFLVPAQVIPTNRSGIDTAAMKQAIRYVKQGSLVGMLPEGRINMSDQFLLPVRPGAALIALRTRVPLVPCYIEGAPFDKSAHSPFLMRARVRVHFGDPIDLSEWYDEENEHEVANRTTIQAMKAIARLAGQPDFEPALAGRRWKPTRKELEEAMETSDRRHTKGRS